MLCKHCGAQIPEGSGFCGECGRSLEGDTEAVHTGPGPATHHVPDEAEPAPEPEAAGGARPPRRAGRAVLSLVLLLALVVTSVLALRGNSPSSDTAIQEGVFDSPEAVITHFFDCLREEDLPGMLSTYAMDSMAENYDPAAYFDRIGTINYYSMNVFPTEYTPYVDLFKMSRMGAAQQELTNLLLCLTLEDELLELLASGKSVEISATEYTAQDYVQAAIPGAMDSLELKDMTVTYLDYEDTIPAVIAEQMGIYGGDGGEYWAACFSLDGQLYVTGFTLIDYGGNWLIYTLNNALIGMSVSEIAVPIDSIELFQELH